MSDSQVIGGVGISVQIDESLFSKRKNHCGRILPAQWVLGGVESDSKNCFVELVPNRTKESLLEVIRRRVKPGTLIITDCWASYVGLENIGYDHLTVNHTYNFVDPQTLVHTQKVENLCFFLKKETNQSVALKGKN